MTIRIQTGNLSDFFESARDTAREIDRGERLTRKNTIWVKPEELPRLLKPRRISLVRYLRGKHQVMSDDLAASMNHTPGMLKRDLSILSEYQLVRVFDHKDSETSEVRKMIEPTFGSHLLEFRAEI